MLLNCAEQLKAEYWRECGVAHILDIAGKQFTDNTPDARSAGRQLLRLLRRVHEQQVSLPLMNHHGLKGNSPLLQLPQRVKAWHAFLYNV